MSNVEIDLTKTVKEIIETMKTAIDNLNTNVDSLKSEVLLAAHPVGSYYISDNATDPGTLFGGTWKMLDPGLALISQGKGTDKFGSFEFVAGQTYGERMHQLTVEELAGHKHQFYLDTSRNGANSYPGSWFVDAGTLGESSSKNTSANRYTEISGGDIPHNNVQPCKAVYVWRRFN